MSLYVCLYITIMRFLCCSADQAASALRLLQDSPLLQNDSIQQLPPRRPSSVLKQSSTRVKHEQVLSNTYKVLDISYVKLLQPHNLGLGPVSQKHCKVILIG